MIDKIELSRLNSVLVDKCDLFICSSSYEDRCLSVANNLNKNVVKTAIIAYNGDYIEYVQNNKEKLEHLFENNSQLVELSLSNPLATADNLKKMLCDAESAGISLILVDITAFTHEALLILLRLLQKFFRNTKLKCVYANAHEYSVGDEKGQKWLSKGIGEIRSVLGYPGKIIPSKRTHLIMIVGYEYERAIEIINTIEPNSLTLVYGRSSSATTEKDEDANEHYLQLVEQMATSYSFIEKFEVPCNDINETYNILNAHINTIENSNIIIVPMNNKLTTLSVALVALNNRDIQICYAPALCYNHLNYSLPGTSCYLFDVDWMTETTMTDEIDI